MQAIDTNVLVYAAITRSAHHEQALSILEKLAQGHLPWAIPWPCIYEFLRVVTHPRVSHPPVPLETALANLKGLAQSATLVLLRETDRHLQVMETVMRQSGATGNLVHDAHIAALCLEHGVSELLTGDRDFLRFPGLKVTNPFAEAGRG